jgi:hypothetical protein
VINFHSTLPWDAVEAARNGVIQRGFFGRRRSLETPITSRLSLLGPSLRRDLARFDQQGPRSELLEVMAAALRHAAAVTVHLRLQRSVLTLTAYPKARLVHCALPMEQFLALPLKALQVLRVEGIQPQPPDLLAVSLQPNLQVHYGSLGKVLWELALRGARDELLPEIAGQAAYRVAPTLQLSALGVSGPLASACERLRRRTTTLSDIALWPGFDRERAMRMLNGLYLQPGLMISRTHPAATRVELARQRPLNAL